MRSIDIVMDWFEVDIASKKIPQSKLDWIIQRHDWLLRPEEERPDALTWDCLQSRFDIGGQDSGWKLFIYNDGVRNPEYVDDDGNMQTAKYKGYPKNANRSNADGILARVFQLINTGYKLNEWESKYWDEIKDQVTLPTQDQMDDMLLNGGEIEISFGRNLDVRAEEAKKKERMVKPDVHVDPDDAYLISDAARAFVESLRPTEEKHVYRLRVGKTDKEALEDQYSWYLITQPWNRNATKKVPDTSLMKKFKQKIAGANPNTVPTDSTACEKGGEHEWLTRIPTGVDVDNGDKVQVCRKCRKVGE
jgi:hypothetical protein